MDAIEAVVGAWREQDARFARVRPYPWGEVVADPRFPHLIVANCAKVLVREPVDAAEVLGAARRDLAHARRLAVVVHHPDEQPDLIVALSAEGGTLFFDDVFAAGRTPSLDTARVGEADTDEPAFWDAFRETSRLFGIDEAALAELETVERDVLLPMGKRWFVVRGADGAIEAMAALGPGPAAEIDHVVTAPAARRRGHATALVARCVAEGRAAGADRVFLLAQAGGDGERIYRRLGFRRIGAFAGWTSAPRDAAGYAPGAGQEETP